MKNSLWSEIITLSLDIYHHNNKILMVKQEVCSQYSISELEWRHDERNGVSNFRRFEFLRNRLLRRRSKKISKLCVTGLCEGNSPMTCGFPSQRASIAEKVSNWWRHHMNPPSVLPIYLTWSSPLLQMVEYETQHKPWRHSLFYSLFLKRLMMSGRFNFTWWEDAIQYDRRDSTARFVLICVQPFCHLCSRCFSGKIVGT